MTKCAKDVYVIRLETEIDKVGKQLCFASKRLEGLNSLVEQLSNTREEVKKAKEKIRQLEKSAAASASFIARLSAQLDPKKPAVAPGPDRKIVDDLMMRNTELVRALENRYGEGTTDLVLENKNLHDIIMTLRDERDAAVQSIQKYKVFLGQINADNVQDIVNSNVHLTKEVEKLQRFLKAKQTFLELVVTDCEELKSLQVNDKRQRTTRARR